MKLDQVLENQKTKSAEVEAEERGLTVKEINYERFAALLTSGMSTEDAALAIGIGVSTGYRWAKEETVVKLVREWRSQVTDGGLRKLQRLMGKSIEVLGEILEDPEVSAQTRGQVAFGILDRLGVDMRQLRAEEQGGNQTVFQNFIHIGTDMAAAQRERALRLQQSAAIDGEYKEVE